MSLSCPIRLETLLRLPFTHNDATLLVPEATPETTAFNQLLASGVDCVLRPRGRLLRPVRNQPPLERVD